MDAEEGRRNGEKRTLSGWRRCLVWPSKEAKSEWLKAAYARVEINEQPGEELHFKENE